MNKLMNIQKVKLMSWGVALCFLFIHIAMILLFSRYGVTPMVRFNLFSISFYIFSLYMTHREWLRAFVVSVYLEVVAHMTLAVWYTGWDGGFQITLIGIVIMVFYSEYLSKSIRRKPVYGLPLSIIGMVAYLSACALNHRYPARYPLPEDVAFWLQIAWGIIVFVIDIFFMEVFVRITTGSEKILSDQATMDPLTGLYNRAGYDQLLPTLDMQNTVLLLIDADRFKSVNDTYGHETGDKVLKKIAEALRQNFRADDRLCRIGGDEFAVLMKRTEDMHDDLLLAKINRINKLLGDTGDALPPISVSVGAVYGAPGQSVNEMFERADVALYQVKRDGGKSCRIYRHPDLKQNHQLPDRPIAEEV